MTADTQTVGADADPGFALTVTDTATPEWVAAWAHCDNRPDIEDHVERVFPRMAGIARFAHAGNRAVGISVELDGLVALYCLAVAPELRRQGVGKSLVRAMLAGHGPSTAYLQVFSQNTAGLALYNSLGFTEAYRYCHAVLPVRGAVDVHAAHAAAGDGVVGDPLGVTLGVTDSTGCCRTGRRIDAAGRRRRGLRHRWRRLLTGPASWLWPWLATSPGC